MIQEMRGVLFQTSSLMNITSIDLGPDKAHLVHSVNTDVPGIIARDKAIELSRRMGLPIIEINWFLVKSLKDEKTNSTVS